MTVNHLPARHLSAPTEGCQVPPQLREQRAGGCPGAWLSSRRCQGLGRSQEAVECWRDHGSAVSGPRPAALRASALTPLQPRATRGGSWQEPPRSRLLQMSRHKTQQGRGLGRTFFLEPRKTKPLGKHRPDTYHPFPLGRAQPTAPKGCSFPAWLGQPWPGHHAHHGQKHMEPSPGVRLDPEATRSP